MAVEAQHMSLFPSQLLTNRDMMKQPNHDVHVLNAAQMDAAMSMPLPCSSTMPESLLLPFYQSSVYCDPTSMNKADSGLTYVPRKRSRESITELNALPVPLPLPLPLPQDNKLSSQSSFLDHQLLYHFHNHQSEIDRFIAQHTEKVKMELEERRMRQSRMLVGVIQEAMEKKLKEKEEEIERMGKVNWALQERVKRLCTENQIWRDLAQTNEATANSLRTNLEQVLAHVSRTADSDDAESSCGSNHHFHEDENEEKVGVGRNRKMKMCNMCGERESIVLLLPCRHLCLCTMCASTNRNCPLCRSRINASVHVNFS